MLARLVAAAAGLATLGLTVLATPAHAQDPEPFSRSAATTYQVTATGKAAQGLGGLVLAIDQSNKRSTEGVPTGWTAPSGDCWVMKKDGSC